MGACDKCCSFFSPSIPNALDNTRTMMRLVKQRLATLAVVTSILAFFATFLTFDFFGTLLALISMIAVASASCHPNVGSNTSACFLALLTGGVGWWNVLVNIITTVCDQQQVSVSHSNNQEDASSATVIIQVTHNTTTVGDGNTTQVVGGHGGDVAADPESEYEFFCSHRTWIITMTLIAAVLWTSVGTMLLLQPPPPRASRRGRRPYVPDEPTVATADDRDPDDLSVDAEEGKTDRPAHAQQRAFDGASVNNNNNSQLPETVEFSHTGADAHSTVEEQNVACSQPPRDTCHLHTSATQDDTDESTSAPTIASSSASSPATKQP